MGSLYLRSGSPGGAVARARRVFTGASTVIVCALTAFLCAPASRAQFLIRSQPGEQITILPSDEAILESENSRKDLPCTVTPHKTELGFDLRFHTGYDVSIPLEEVAGAGEVLTVLFRVYPEGKKVRDTYFVQHFRVPAIPQETKGNAVLEGSIDLGEGQYHVDWLMRDRAERLCSSNWDVEATLPPKDRPMPLFIGPNEIAQTLLEPFVNDEAGRGGDPAPEGLNVKLLVNFAPQDSLSAALRRSDTDALVSILKSIQRNPQIGRISLVAFNIEEGRVVYRQESARQIDFPALGKALETMKLGTVNVARLEQRHSDTDFLADLIQKEVGQTARPDAVIFAGPKAMLDADVPQSDLRRIGDIECPVFYMNYNLNPQAVPWKDSISHAIKAFKGTEYTISRPRDLWLSTTEMLNRIVRSKRDRALARAAGASE